MFQACISVKIRNQCVLRKRASYESTCLRELCRACEGRRHPARFACIAVGPDFVLGPSGLRESQGRHARGQCGHRLDRQRGSRREVVERGDFAQVVDVCECCARAARRRPRRISSAQRIWACLDQKSSLSMRNNGTGDAIYNDNWASFIGVASQTVAKDPLPSL